MLLSCRGISICVKSLKIGLGWWTVLIWRSSCPLLSKTHSCRQRLEYYYCREREEEWRGQRLQASSKQLNLFQPLFGPRGANSPPVAPEEIQRWSGKSRMCWKELFLGRGDTTPVVFGLYPSEWEATTRGFIICHVFVKAVGLKECPIWIMASWV